MQNIVLLLTAIATLLSNPKVQANPALLAEVQGLNRAAIALISELETVPVQTPVVQQYAPDNQTMPNLGETPPAQGDSVWVCWDPTDSRGIEVGGNTSTYHCPPPAEYMPLSQYSAMFK